MDRRDRRECPGLGRAVVKAGRVGTPRRGRVPGLPSRDHALLRRGGGRDRGPDRCGCPPAASVGPPRGGAPPTGRWVAACVTATVVSHLYLDWQGSYGLRPFLPWSAQWYYADWVAIVDPFFWVVPLVALAWGARRHWAPALAYLLALVGVTTLVLWRGNDLVAWWVQLGIVGCAAAGVVGWMRHWFGVAGRRRAAGDGLGVLVADAAATAGGGGAAKAQARAAAEQRLGPAARWAALPVVGRPFRWEAPSPATGDVAGRGWAVARHLDHPAG